jgi:hypothetical protein
MNFVNRTALRGRPDAKHSTSAARPRAVLRFMLRICFGARMLSKRPIKKVAGPSLLKSYSHNRASTES